MPKKLKPKLQVRDNVVDFLKRTQRFLKNYVPDTHGLQVQTRMDKLDEKWDEFEDIQAQIEEMDEHEEKADDHKRIRAEFEELYFQKDWEEFALKKQDPTFRQVMEFLEGQTRILDAVAVDQRGEVQRVPFSTPPKSFKRSVPKLAVNTASESSSTKCISCNGSHYITNCPAFAKMTLEKRFQVVNSKKLCSNCLRREHYSRDCKSSFRCRTCNKKHHSLLHPGFSASGSSSATGAQESIESQTGGSDVSTTTVAPVEVPQQVIQSSVATIYAANVAAESREVHVFLSTVLLSVKDCNGRAHMARALLDSGSQANLMTERLCQVLKLPRKQISVPIAGVGNARVQINSSVSATIVSRITDYVIPMDFLVLKKVTEDQPSTTIPVSSWNLPSDMVLADPGFNKRAPIDLLLGLEYFYEFLLLNGGRVQIQRVGEGIPLFVNTVFGWIAAGKADLGSLNPIPCCHVTANTTLEEKIERFWSIEELQDVPRRTQEEQDCEEHFQATFSRDSEGRYVVRLPKRTGFEQMIGESRNTALRRLLQLERRLAKDSNLRKGYNEAMQTYLELNHMTELTKGHRWNHVKGTENPADLVSRGVMPKDLVDKHHWFHGPDWLSLLDQHWNTERHLEYERPSEELLERKKNVMIVADSQQPHPLLDRYSNYWKLLRITAYVLKFIRRCQHRRSPPTSSPWVYFGLVAG
nr:uncharacterized protein LOC109417500 [Aedes albopictus]